MKGPFELYNEDGTLYGFFWEPEPGDKLPELKVPLMPNFSIPQTTRSIVEFTSYNPALKSKTLPFKF